MLADLLLFVAICVLHTLAGVSLLALVRVRIDPEVRLLLAPSALQAAWACALSLGVAANVPVRVITPWIWSATLTLALAGAGIMWRSRRGEAGLPASAVWRLRARMAALPVWCAALALGALAPYLGSGLIEHFRGSGVPDGWSYVAVGQFLWAHGQDSAADGLTLLHRYGSAFAHQRFVAPGELGVLSWLIEPGDTRLGAGLLQALSLWAFAMSVAAFARLRGHPSLFSAAVVTLATLSGWIANLVWLSNYDHGLALTFAPALMALAISAEGASVGGALLIALLAAGTLHTYPELSPVMLGTTGAAYAVQAWLGRQLLSRLGLGLLSILVAAALVGIYWPDYLNYLRYQTTTRPALAILHGLVEPRFMLSAFWALGGEHRALLQPAAQQLAGLLLCLVLGRGVVRLVRRGDTALALALVLFVGGAAYGMFVWQYGYGTYKVLLSGWWLIAYTLAVACVPPRPRPPSHPGQTGAAVSSGLWARLASLACIGAVSAIPGAVIARNLLVMPTKQPQPMADLRVLDAVPHLIGQESVGLLVDNLDATAWALYFLRDLPSSRLRIGDYSGYPAAPHLRARIEAPDAPAWPRVRFLLTDRDDRGPVTERHGWRLVWRKGAFALWDTDGQSWGVVTDVQVGDEVVVQPLPAVPLGPAPTHLTIAASTAGLLTLTPAEPLASAIDPQRLDASCDRGGLIAVNAAASVVRPALQVRVTGGETRCTLHAQEAFSLGRLQADWSPR